MPPSRRYAARFPGASRRRCGRPWMRFVRCRGGEWPGVNLPPGGLFVSQPCALAFLVQVDAVIGIRAVPPPLAPGGLLGEADAGTARAAFVVAEQRGGFVDYAIARAAGAETQVGIVVIHREERVETAQLLENGFA